jgi:hypothetical protein
MMKLKVARLDLLQLAILMRKDSENKELNGEDRLR